MATKPGELVVDPFVGSGTTGLACLAIGRRFLGADVDPGAVSLATERLESTTAPGTSQGNDSPNPYDRDPITIGGGNAVATD